MQIILRWSLLVYRERLWFHVMDEATKCELSKVQDEESNTPFLVIVIEVRSSSFGDGGYGESNTCDDDRTG